MPKVKPSPGQIVLFPGLQPALSRPHRHKATTQEDVDQGTTDQPFARHYSVALCGTYRKDVDGLRRLYEELRDAGCQVLSPRNVKAVQEVDGFVYMDGEESELPEEIEARHLDAIQNSHFVWLHAPDGYVGPTAALEVGFARAIGVPAFCKTSVRDPVLRSFVELEDGPANAIKRFAANQVPPPQPALKAFQNYYRRIAIQRGYSKEDARQCLLLMVEEVGELARAIRKREKIARHGGPAVSEADELADVFLYVVHMANILNLDLSKAVSEKELLNLQKFLRA